MTLKDHIEQAHAAAREAMRAPPPLPDPMDAFWQTRRALTQPELLRIKALFEALEQRDLLRRSAHVQFYRHVMPGPVACVVGHRTMVYRNGMSSSSPRRITVQSPTYIFAVCDEYVFELGNQPLELQGIDTLTLQSKGGDTRRGEAKEYPFRPADFEVLSRRLPYAQLLQGVTRETVGLIGQRRQDDVTQRFLRQSNWMGYVMLLTIVLFVLGVVMSASLLGVVCLGIAAALAVAVMPFRNRWMAHAHFVAVPISVGGFVRTADLAPPRQARGSSRLFHRSSDVG